MNRRNILFLLLFCVFTKTITAYLFAFDQKQDDCVLETKRIFLEQYPYAFNPSLSIWHGMILMSFRVIPDPKFPFNSWIGIVQLDENFRPISNPQRLYIQGSNPHIPGRFEEGRLVCSDNKLYLIYSNNEDIVVSKEGFRVYKVELYLQGTKFFVRNKECFSSFEGNSKYKREKNWVPFSYNNNLFFAYSLQPHKILQQTSIPGHYSIYSISDSPFFWEWGELRGGTPALMDDDHYLAFFHSCIKIPSSDDDNKKNLLLHYFIGAYTFEKNPPFRITHISKKPLWADTFYSGNEYMPYWNPVKVVFPCGFIMNNKNIWLSYGRQDHELWVAKIDKRKLYKSLTPVEFHGDCA